MMLYLFKTMLSSALLLLAYLLLLQREKMLFFNRCYLLLCLPLSFIIPLISVSARMPLGAAATDYLPVVARYAGVHKQTVFEGGRSIHWIYVLLAVYGTVVAWRAWRFVKNLFAIVRKIRKSSSFALDNASIVLTEDPMPAHSFLKYIFIEKGCWEKGSIREEIIYHELAHVRQLHSLDVLFIEMLLVFCWFNPVFYWYRKAIRLNHEFLADAGVIRRCPDVAAYQYLLLENIARPKDLFLQSTLTYSITKKRFMMMTKQTTWRTAIIKMTALIPFVVVTIFLFITKADAQVQAPTKPAVTANRKLKIDTSRMEIVYIKNSPLPRITPSTAQLKEWENPQVYGVWIDGKKVKNEQLQQYVNTDFGQVFISKLGRNTLHYGEYYYQVDLMTSAYYEAYNQETIDHPLMKAYRRKAGL